MSNGEFPPGPPSGLLGWGLMKKVQRDFLGFSRELFDEYGDTVGYRIGPIRIFQFTHPEQCHEVLVAHNKKFHKTKRLLQTLGRWNGNGLLLNEGESWTRQRRLVQPAFAPTRMNGYAEAIVRYAEEAFAPYAGERVDISDVLHRLTFRSVAEALFGADVDDIADEFREAVATLQSESIADFTAAWVRPLWWPTASRARLRKAMRFLDDVVRGFIASRRASG